MLETPKPDFSKTFEVVSATDPQVRYVFRRLTVAQAAALRLEVMQATQPHVREIEKIRAAGATDLEIESYSAVATTATTIPLTIKHTLKHVMLGDRKMKAEDWLADPETSEDLAFEAFLAGSRGSRMTAEQLGEWLSPGTCSLPAQASATNSDATTASASASMKPETAGDTSPTA